MGTARAIASERIALCAAAIPSAYATPPKSVHTAKYPVAIAHVQSARRGSPRNAAVRRYSSSIGKVDGSIIATIMAAHIAIKISAAAGQLWPGMRIHIMDMRQPPGIGMLADMERADHNVAAAATAKTATAPA